MIEPIVKRIAGLDVHKMDEELSERHIFLLKTLQEHIQFLKSKLEAIDAYLMENRWWCLKLAKPDGTG